jgi:hypothetical protein
MGFQRRTTCRARPCRMSTGRPATSTLPGRTRSCLKNSMTGDRILPLIIGPERVDRHRLARRLAAGGAAARKRRDYAGGPGFRSLPEHKQNHSLEDTMPVIKIGDRLVGDGQPTYIIAEIGVNHNGILPLAIELIDASVDAGADAVKFQKRSLESSTPANTWITPTPAKRRCATCCRSCSRSSCPTKTITDRRLLPAGRASPSCARLSTGERRLPGQLGTPASRWPRPT